MRFQLFLVRLKLRFVLPLVFGIMSLIGYAVLLLLSICSWAWLAVSPLISRFLSMLLSLDLSYLAYIKSLSGDKK